MVSGVFQGGVARSRLLGKGPERNHRRHIVYPTSPFVFLSVLPG
jgi:hypothetical protein